MKDLIQERLEAASATCGDPVRKALIDAERAYHAARSGRFQISRELLKSIRDLPQSQFAPSVAIWVMLADGIVEFFEDLHPHAHDRFKRAFALSASIGDADLRALSSAWLAHVEFNQRNYPAMVSSINQSLAIYPRGRTSSHSRMFMVLANANLYAGNMSVANLYYEKSRVIAVADGDRATVGAVVYNRAALMLNNYRLQHVLDMGESIDISFVTMAVESAAAFQNMTMNKSLEELPLMSEARLAIIRGDFPLALDIVNGIRTSEHRHRGGAKDCLLDIEYLYCLAHSGEVGRARAFHDEVDASRCTELDNDDRIIFLSHLIKIRDRIGCDDSDLRERLRVAVAEFSEELISLRDVVSSIKYPM